MSNVRQSATEKYIVSLKFLILPGMGNSDENHWQSLWESQNSYFTRIQQNDWENPNCTDWKIKLEESVCALGQNTILIAHSLSCLLVAHWASCTKLKIAGALLVAPPDPRAHIFPKEALSFSDFPMIPFSFLSAVVASENDPYADLEFSRHCANSWGSVFVNIGMCGHVNSFSGFGYWPYGKLLLDNLIKKINA